MAARGTRILLGVVIVATGLMLLVLWYWNHTEYQYSLASAFAMFNWSNSFTGENPDVFQPFRNVFDSSEEPTYLSGSENRTQKEKYFIYRCDNSLMPCGGHADRIKGAMTAYMIANLTGRTFKMQMFFGSCDFHKYVVPNKIDWYVQTSFHKSVKEAVKAGNASHLNYIDRYLSSSGKDKDFLALPGMESKYLYFQGNKDSTRIFQASRRYRQQLSWMSQLNYSEMNEALYKHLFKPSQYLQDKVTMFFKQHLQPKDNLVCAHFRFARNPTIPSDTPPRIKKEHVPNLWKFLDEELKRKANAKVFIMTDNDAIVCEVKKRQSERIFVSPGKIMHVDRSYSSKISTETVCESFEKVIFDQLVLMHCDVLVVGRSGLSQMAAYMRAKDDGLYCFGPTGEVLPCKRNEIRKVFYND